MLLIGMTPGPFENVGVTGQEEYAIRWYKLLATLVEGEQRLPFQ